MGDDKVEATHMHIYTYNTTFKTSLLNIYYLDQGQNIK